MARPKCAVPAQARMYLSRVSSDKGRMQRRLEYTMAKDEFKVTLVYANTGEEVVEKVPGEMTAAKLREPPARFAAPPGIAAKFPEALF